MLFQDLPLAPPPAASIPPSPPPGSPGSGRPSRPLDPRTPDARPERVRDARDPRVPDPREGLSYELRGLVNQLLGRHLRGEGVQGTMVGGPLHGQRYLGPSDQVSRAVEGVVHRYVRVPLPVVRKRRGALTLFLYDGTGAQQVMDLG